MTEKEKEGFEKLVDAAELVADEAIHKKRFRRFRSSERPPLQWYKEAEACPAERKIIKYNRTRRGEAIL